MKDSDGFQESIAEHVILYAPDAEHGEGIGIARRYGVNAYPSFVLVSADGEVMDRWLGYGDTAPFLATLEEATTAPLTLSERKKRFRGEPNAADAVKIGDLQRDAGLSGEALAWYHRAESLDATRFLGADMLEAYARGARDGLYSREQVRDQAMAVLKDERASSRQVAETVALIDRGTQDGDRQPYLTALELGVQRLSMPATDEDRRLEAGLRANYAVLVDKDSKAAYGWKVKSLEPGWQEDANALNGLAWWCFENSVALDKAEKHARKGVALADDPSARANVMDTLAEICNARGDCGEALELIQGALQLVPDNEYLQKQLARFEKLVAEQKQG